jgi:RNA polymerase sigma-70 factor (ECF subfamily)
LCVTLLGSRNDADEVFQEVSLLIWRDWDKFDSSRDFVRWAGGYAVNVVRNQRRKSTDRPILSDELLDQIAETRNRSDDRLEARRKALEGCLEELQQDQQQLVAQCYSGSDSIRALASSRNVEPNAMYKRLERLRRILFDCVQRNLQSEGMV